MLKVLTAIGCQFEYEQFVHYKDRFFFPDFVIGRTVVECTWYNPEQKAKELKLIAMRRPGLNLF